jgi:protein-S-isoprenylcysteine O-methyltransferase Ste14
MYMTAASFLAFALLHSLTVSRSFKRLATSVIGEVYMRAYYRLAFTAFSALITALAAYFIALQPDTVVYRPGWYVVLPACIIQLAGVVILYAAMRPFDLGFFTGIRQAREFRRTGRTGGDIEGIEGNALITAGIYGRVRHPMYLAGILIFLFEPTVTMNNLVLRILAVGYFVFGALIEERRFINDFGDSYRRYQREVPMFNIMAKKGYQ